jgi:hypothetical protein
MTRDRYSLYALEASFLNRTNEVDELVVALCTKTLVAALTIAPVTIPSRGHAKGCIKMGPSSAVLPATLYISAGHQDFNTPSV